MQSGVHQILVGQGTRLLAAYEQFTLPGEEVPSPRLAYQTEAEVGIVFEYLQVRRRPGEVSRATVVDERLQPLLSLGKAPQSLIGLDDEPLHQDLVGVGRRGGDQWRQELYHSLPITKRVQCSGVENRLRFRWQAGEIIIGQVAQIARGFEDSFDILLAV